MQWKWHVSWSPFTRGFYAVRNLPRMNGKQGNISMHRMILGLGASDPRHGDHKESGHTLDNRRANLRIATRSQNAANQRITRTSTSRLKGISRADSIKNPWKAQICVDGKGIHLGSFPTKELAHAAYVEAAKRLHGEFARIE
jgi:hypothetical protein